jgi:eukaryotic-like serine/threonine-protein kinase
MTEIYTGNLPRRLGPYLLLHKTQQGLLSPGFIAAPLEDRSRLLEICLLLDELAAMDKITDLLAQEVNNVKTLAHPALLQVHDVGSAEGRRFWVREYVGGQALGIVARRHAEARGELPIAMALHIVARVCEALATGHEHGLVHGSLDPLGILVTYDGQVKLRDFGLEERLLSLASALGWYGILRGKRFYWAPEQVRAQPSDHRADLYIIGMILYKLLTGRRVFEADSEFGILEKAKDHEIERPSLYRKEISPELEALLLSCLARHPADRVQTAGALAEALNELVQAEAIMREQLAQTICALFPTESAQEEQTMTACRSAASEFV